MTDINVEKINQIAVVTLASKSGMNYIDESSLHELSENVEALDNDDDVKVIVVRGSEKAFSSGIEPNSFVRKVNHDLLDGMFDDFRKISNIRKPLIAEVSGYAIGIGFELAMACDMIFCSDNTWFSLPDLSMGVVPAFGSTQRLPKAIGKAKTMELLLTGRAMSGDEADRTGLVTRVVPLSYLHKETMKVADILVSMPEIALTTSKELVKTAIGNASLSEGLEIERQVYKSSFETDEYRNNLENMIKK